MSQIKDRDKPIGIFDSGVGGLTVLKEINTLMPDENIIYFGDTARVPYGSKSTDTIIRYSHENMHFLLSKNIKLAVVACNTASSVALNELKKFYRIPIIGVVEPGAREAVNTGAANIGIIGTKRTIRSGSYTEHIKKLSKKTNIYKKACPLFVPLIEEGIINDPITELIIKKYLNNIMKKISVMVLGCTHYPLIKDKIKEIYPDVSLVDSSIETAKSVKKMLISEKIKRTQKKGNIEFFVSDKTETFSKLGRIILGKKLQKIQINRFS